MAFSRDCHWAASAIFMSFIPPASVHAMYLSGVCTRYQPLSFFSTFSGTPRVACVTISLGWPGFALKLATDMDTTADVYAPGDVSGSVRILSIYCLGSACNNAVLAAG